MRITCESDSCWRTVRSQSHRSPWDNQELVARAPCGAGHALQRVRRHAYPAKDYTTRLGLQAVFGEGLHC